MPTFWEQRGLTAHTRLTRNNELTNAAFLKHFDFLTKNYSRILSVNLMTKFKKHEQMITESFESHIINNNLSNARYEYFDFHSACKNQKFDKVNPLIRKLQLMNENFRFYVEDLKDQTVLMTQKGY